MRSVRGVRSGSYGAETQQPLHNANYKATWFEWNTIATAAQEPTAFQLRNDGSAWDPVGNTSSLADFLEVAQCTNAKVMFSSALIGQGGIDTFMNATTNGVTYQIRRGHAYVVESVDGGIVKLYDPADEAVDDPDASNKYIVFVSMTDFIRCGRAVNIL